MDTQEKRKREVQSRKSSDGTFELYVGPNGEGLQEISEDEVSVAEVLAPPTEDSGTRLRRAIPVSPKVAIVSVIAVLLVVAGVGLFSVISNSESDDDAFVDGEFPSVEGFKPYGGNVASRTKNTPRQRLNKTTAASLNKAMDDEDKKLAAVEESEDEEEETEEVDENAKAWAVKDPVDSEVVIDETNDDSSEVEDDEEESPALNANARKTLTPSKSSGINSLRPGLRPTINTKSNSYNAFKKPNLDVVKGIQGIRDNNGAASDEEMETDGDEGEDEEQEE